VTTLTDEIARRRNFAIISHPDAGETTLTEKLLLFGGAIQLAGEVKARGDRRRARSDWMAIGREPGVTEMAPMPRPPSVLAGDRRLFRSAHRRAQPE